MTEVLEVPELVAGKTVGCLPAPLRRIVEHALSWQESAPYFRSDRVAADANSQEKLLERWKTLLTMGAGEDAFPKRLEQLGWSSEEAFDHLAPVSLPDEAPLPEWAAVLAEVMELAGVTDDMSTAEAAYAKQLCENAIGTL